MNWGRCSLTLWLIELNFYSFPAIPDPKCFQQFVSSLPALTFSFPLSGQRNGLRKCLVWRRQRENALCMGKGGNDRETVTRKPDDREKWVDICQWMEDGKNVLFSEWFSTQCWAPRPSTGNKLLITRPVVLLKIHLHWPRANSIEIIGNVSRGF